MANGPREVMIVAKEMAAKAAKDAAMTTVRARKEQRDGPVDNREVMRAEIHALNTSSAYLHACYVLYGVEPNAQDAYRYRGEMLVMALEMAVDETDRIISG